MNVLITGGAGYVGSHIAWLLHDKGHNVTIVDSLVTGFKELIPPSAIFYEGNINRMSDLIPAFRDNKIEAIIHCAGSLIVEEAVRLPMKYYRNNLEGTMNVLDMMNIYKVPHILFSSTAAVYGENEHPLVDEATRPNPINPYGYSKLMAERIIRDCVKTMGFDASCGILRYFNVAGADPGMRTGDMKPRATHLIKVALETAMGVRKGPVQIFGTDFDTEDGTGIRDYIHVSDLAQAHLDTLVYMKGHPKVPELLFNVGYGHGYSVRDVLAAVCRNAKPVFTEEAPRRPGDPAAVVADPHHIKARLKWRPQYDDLDKMIRDAYRWEEQMSKQLYLFQARSRA